MVVLSQVKSFKMGEIFLGLGSIRMVVWNFPPNEIAKDLETRMDRLFCKKPLMAAAAQSASGDDVCVQLPNRFDLFFHQMAVTKSHGSKEESCWLR